MCTKYRLKSVQRLNVVVTITLILVYSVAVVLLLNVRLKCYRRFFTFHCFTCVCISIVGNDEAKKSLIYLQLIRAIHSYAQILLFIYFLFCLFLFAVCVLLMLHRIGKHLRVRRISLTCVLSLCMRLQTFVRFIRLCLFWYNLFCQD